MEHLRVKREMEKSKFTVVETFLNNAIQLAEEAPDDQYPLGTFVEILKLLESAYVEILSIQDQIMELLDLSIKDETDDFTTYAESIEESYRTLKTRLRRRMSTEVIKLNFNKR